MIEYWRSTADGQWYWHVVSGNYRLVGNGGQGFSRKDSVVRSIARFRQLVANSAVTEIEEP